MRKYSQDEIIDGLRRRDDRVMHYIYKAYYPIVLKLILDNRGTEEDAKDIFQETIVAIFRKFRDNADYQISSDFVTFLYSIARWLWIKQLRRLKYFDEALKDSRSFIYFEEPEPFMNDELKQALFQKAFLQLPQDCQTIIKMSNDGILLKNVALKLGVKSENYIKKRKHYCKEFLIQKIREDPRYKEGS